jgi:hypothetical protein
LASRTAWAGTATTEVFDVADANSLPGGWIGYVQVTADQTGITAETNLTGLSQAVTVGTSRRLKLSCHMVLSKSVATTRSIVRIKEGATTLEQCITGHISTVNHTITGWVIITPSSGSHTYNLSLESLDSGSASLSAGVGFPAQLLIEDVGPA